jgi:hypothetical protein
MSVSYGMVDAVTQKNQELLSQQIDGESRRALLIAALAVGILTADVSVIATHSEEKLAQSHIIHQAVDMELTEQQKHAAAERAAIDRQLERKHFLNDMSAKVPLATYAGALLTSPRSLVGAEQRVIALGLPPLPVERAVAIGKPLKIAYPKEEQVSAAKVVEQWIDLAKAGKIKIDLKRSTANIFKTLTPEQESETRERIARVMDNELALNVKEVPDNSNLGPRVNYYLGYHVIKPEHPEGQEWCGAYVSTVYMLSGLPLNGGRKYSRKTPDYLLTRAAEPNNPNENPRIPSVSDWFKNNAYYFPKGTQTPAIGDAVFMHRTTKDGKIRWHTGLVRGVTKNGSLVTHEGNSSNALIRKVYPNYRENNFIIGFGSFFPSEQAPQSVPPFPLIELPSTPKDSEIPLSELPVVVDTKKS